MVYPAASRRSYGMSIRLLILGKEKNLVFPFFFFYFFNIVIIVPESLERAWLPFVIRACYLQRSWSHLESTSESLTERRLLFNGDNSTTTLRTPFEKIFEEFTGGRHSIVSPRLAVSHGRWNAEEKLPDLDALDFLSRIDVARGDLLHSLMNLPFPRFREQASSSSQFAYHQVVSYSYDTTPGPRISSSHLLLATAQMSHELYADFENIAVTGSQPSRAQRTALARPREVADAVLRFSIPDHHRLA